MYNPISTYRLQFHKDFSFEAFEKVIPYLKKLGVSTIYASPIFHSTAGSTHGYDSMNPHQINPEIGDEEQLKRISADLRKNDIGWLQDIVPNHMAFHPDNKWLMDVLEKGRKSIYASFFDIGWDSSVHEGKLMVPFLGAPLDEVTSKGEIKLEYRESRLGLNYYDSLYPLNPRSYQTVLSTFSSDNQSVKQLLSQITELDQVEDLRMYAQQWEEIQSQIASLAKNDRFKTALERNIQTVNSNHEQLLRIVNEQSYSLCHWQETDRQINYRRFFTVNGLICLNIHNEEVFQHFHSYIKSLSEQGIFQGLRIDHIDGLYDPEKYLQALRKLVGKESYLTVEKILEPGEELPEWPIEGNTGYDFLATVNNLFSNRKNKKAYTKFYKKLTGSKIDITEQIHSKKAYILNQHMQGELENLYLLFKELELADEKSVESASENLKKTIAKFLIYCPVYRHYGNQFPLKKAEKDAVYTILEEIVRNYPSLTAEVGILEDVLIKKPQAGNNDYNARALRFYQRLMQFTGPLMAKGVEDTLMYTYNRFIDHNEVGDSPESFGISVKDFHQKMTQRQKKWPLSINATATHDTKRGEDVRARLNALSDLPDEWFEVVELWQYLNAPLKQDNAPDLNDEYFIYQTLVGAFPMPGEDEDDFKNRIQLYLEKALREAKQNSNWSQPNQDYENATKNFTLALLETDKPFWKHFQRFQRKIVDYGIVNSLAQVLLKFTCPGLPDVYQGCELWDFSLVDPDNRRPVDYNKRMDWLDEIDAEHNKEDLANRLWNDRLNGKIKLWLTSALLNERKASSEVFKKAEYIPLKVRGKYKEHILAFARKHKQTWYLVAVPLHLATLSKAQNADLRNIKWKNTRIVLPDEMPGIWENVLLRTKGKAEKEIQIESIFDRLPFGILKFQQPFNSRSAGILLHITSLPSPYCVGDFGPEAKKFVDSLYRSKQKLWQILPLSPTEAGQGYSPYSSISSMAGNTLLISPDILVKEGFLSQKDLPKAMPSKDQADFIEAEKIKEKLFERAYQNFLSGSSEELKLEFSEFCKKEAYWLNDYALYIALKLYFSGKPWYQWPVEAELRDPKALESFATREDYVIGKTKWLQFIFMRQWQSLKNYANDLGIQLFGDLPFYVSYDSADVWANREIFKLDAQGQQIGTAGVPPDYFNDSGQLWGMPVFRWDVLEQQDYDWWIKRISKNMELFDLLRLDHFRAFSSYWEVPANKKTAINGEWIKGPGSKFFKALEQKLGKLSFIAEDLGGIDQPVYDLRDELNLPGMKILQFAFGDNLPESIDIPHNHSPNFFVYTGTHDNNTTLGWFHQEATEKEIRERIETYTGIKPTDKNISDILCRLAYSSVAKTAILPLQDILSLDENSRMNTPATANGNWSWRMLPDQFHKDVEKKLSKMVQLFNRR